MTAEEMQNLGKNFAMIKMFANANLAGAEPAPESAENAAARVLFNQIESLGK